MRLNSLLALCLCACAASACAEPARFQFPEAPGKYGVGLRIVNQYDYSRTYIAIDDLGKPVSGEVARPIETLVWYPANVTSQKHLTYGDYLNLAVYKDTFAPTAAQIAAAQKQRDAYKDVMTLPVWAVKDAAPADGNFPLVVYAPSFSNYPFENEDLCEYLASHGYIVVSSPSLGAHAINMSSDLLGINAQAADIGFVMSYARTLPHVDMSEIAIAGFSWGGISNLFTAARDSRIKALVSLDGSARYYPKLVHDSGDVKPMQMKLPILFFEQELTIENLQKYKLDLSSNVLNDLKYSDLTLVHMHAMHHGDFASSYQRSTEYQAGREPTEYSPAEAWVSYGWVCRYAVEFLDSVLKHDPDAEAFIKNAPEKNGVPNHLLGVEHNPSQGTPATFDNFRVELNKQGFSHASEIYAKFKTQDADFKLTDGEIGEWSGDLADQGHLPEAIEVAKFGISQYPDASSLYSVLADADDRSGDKQGAIDNYKKALEKDPSDEGVKKKLKDLGVTLPPATEPEKK